MDAGKVATWRVIRMTFSRENLGHIRWHDDACKNIKHARTSGPVGVTQSPSRQKTTFIFLLHMYMLSSAIQFPTALLQASTYICT
jgi:hypothetical protein